MKRPNPPRINNKTGACYLTSLAPRLFQKSRAYKNTLLTGTDQQCERVSEVCFCSAAHRARWFLPEGDVLWYPPLGELRMGQGWGGRRVNEADNRQCDNK